MQVKVQLLVVIMMSSDLTIKSISSQNLSRHEVLELEWKKLRFFSPPADITASLREKIVLVCRVMGKPNPTIHWLKNGVRMSRSNSSIIPNCAYEKLPKKELAITTSRLHLNCMTKKRAAVYTCVAETPLTRVYQNHTVNVDRNSTLTDLPDCRTQRRDGFPARISMYTQVMFEYVNRKARLFCRVDGIPLPNTTSWFDKNGRPIASGIKYRIGKNGDLIIKKLTVDDGGFYKCEVENEHGSDSVLTSLTVDFSVEDVQADKNKYPTLPFISQPFENKLAESNITKPNSSQNAFRAEIVNILKTKLRFTSQPSNITASLRERIVLQCGVTGEGNPTIHWLKNGVRMSQSNSSIMPKCAYEKLPKKELAVVTSRLYLNCITEESAAVYTCVAETPFARNSKNYTVNVDTYSTLNDLDNCTTQNSTGFPARISMYTQALWEYLNREARLYCRVQGISLHGRTSWDKNGRPLASGIKYRISGNGDLIIKKLTFDDGGLYKCKVENQHGSDSIQTFLTVDISEDEVKAKNLPTLSRNSRNSTP